jgi:CheY-like chemotaxis protein
MTKPIVLVVDDHPVNTRLVRFVLESRDLEVTTATDAETALAAMEARPPDLILMDVQLPGTDGLTLTRRIRTDERFARVPIVAVTAYAMARDESAAMDAGCNAFVSKPINTRALGELVLSLLAERKPGSSA